MNSRYLSVSVTDVPVIFRGRVRVRACMCMCVSVGCACVHVWVCALVNTGLFPWSRPRLLEPSNANSTRQAHGAGAAGRTRLEGFSRHQTNAVDKRPPNKVGTRRRSEPTKSPHRRQRSAKSRKHSGVRTNETRRQWAECQPVLYDSI